VAHAVSVRAFASRISGTVIPAVPVPFGRESVIDSAAMLGYARWMAHQRVGGVAVWAHTGRGLQLTAAARAQVLATWTQAVGRKPIICGVGAPASASLPEDAAKRTERVIALTVEMAESAKRGGAAALLVHPPTALRHLSDVEARALDLHRAVAAVGLPMLAFYLYEAAGGLAYRAETIAGLLALDQIVGIKVATLDSVMTFQRLAATVAEREDVLLVTGEDRFLGYSLALGAHAALVGMAAVCTDRCIDLLDAWFSRDLPTYVRLTAALDDFAMATFVEPMDGYVQRMLWALEADGVIPEGARDPFGPPLPRDERERVASAVRRLRAE